LAILIATLLGGCDLRRGSDSDSSEIPEAAVLQKRLAALRKENTQLQARINKLIPKEPYIVINTTLNRLYFARGTRCFSMRSAPPAAIANW